MVVGEGGACLEWGALQPLVQTGVPGAGKQARRQAGSCLPCCSHPPTSMPPFTGVDYLKYDNCRARREKWILDRYGAMRDALNATGRPIVYSLCQWGVMDAHLWSPEVGNSWRTTEVG